MLIAVTREISPAIERCELTHLGRATIDLDRARSQHEAYRRALEQAGCTVLHLEGGPEMPDSVFVEDAAVVLDEVAVVTRPGAASRRGEVAAVADLLGRYRPLARIERPATLDGGDVLVVGRTMFVGASGRTNPQGIKQLRAAVAPHGYSVRPVRVTGCLHLKSAVAAASDRTLVINPAWVNADEFRDFELIDVHPGEPFAANVLRVGAELFCAASCPRTRDRLVGLGFHPRAIDQSELAKAEGGLTCCSLVFSAKS